MENGKSGISKEKLVGWLTENKSSIENLKKKKISQLLVLEDPKILEMTDSQVANLLIDYFKKSENYLKLFK